MHCTWRAVKAIDLVELPKSDACCGFGGTYALQNADMFPAMLIDEIAAVTATHADFCTAN